MEGMDGQAEAVPHKNLDQAGLDRAGLDLTPSAPVSRPEEFGEAFSTNGRWSEPCQGEEHELSVQTDDEVCRGCPVMPARVASLCSTTRASSIHTAGRLL